MSTEKKLFVWKKGLKKWKYEQRKPKSLRHLSQHKELIFEWQPHFKKLPYFWDSHTSRNYLIFEAATLQEITLFLPFSILCNASLDFFRLLVLCCRFLWFCYCLESHLSDKIFDALCWLIFIIVYCIQDFAPKLVILFSLFVTLHICPAIVIILHKVFGLLHSCKS